MALVPTIIKNEKHSALTFCEETKLLTLFRFNSHNKILRINDYYENNNIQIDKNFVSDNKKIIIQLNVSFFHFYIESFANFLKEYYNDNNIEVIVVQNFNNDLPFNDFYGKINFIKMFFKFLEDNNIKYSCYQAKEMHNCIINNFYSFVFNDLSENSGNMLYKMSQKYVIDKNIKNKVYARSNRIKNEIELENFLKNFGFIIYQGNQENDFIEQMQYFYDTSILISATCGALVNSSFMKEKSTIIELVTPVKHYKMNEKNELILNENKEFIWDRDEIHNIYNILSFQKNHKYIGISNIDKTAEDIINLFKEDENFMKILES